MDKNTDTHNVIDYYRNWELEEAKADLETRRTPLVNICMNLKSNFNKSAVIRSNNAFLGRKVVFVGEYDGAPYSHVESSTSLALIIESLRSEGYKIWAVDNIEKFSPVSIFEQEMPLKSAFVYGSEQSGLEDDDVNLCDGMVFIPMPGAARSFNIAQAAAIVMSEYNRQQVSK